MKEHFGSAIRITTFIVIFAVIMHFMNFCFVPSNWASIDRWEQYSSKRDVDTLFVGSSVGWVVVPRTIEGLNNCRPVNMSTPNQFYKTSLEAVRFISCQQPLETVVLLTGFEGLEDAEDYAAAEAFLTAQYETAPFWLRAWAVFKEKAGRYTDTSFLLSLDSVNIWFDWVESFSYSIPEILKNTAYRRSRLTPPYTLDFTKSVERISPSGNDPAYIDEDIAEAEMMNLTTLDIDPRSLKALDEMAAYLAANDIRFVVIVTPHRSDVGAGYMNEYEVIDSYFERFVEKRGGQYHNIDTDPELREQLPDDMFMDREHIVDEGNNIVSEKIAQLLR
ncbi:MAG: hypothetical protein K6E49_06435 [Lachnospiraceae bacterium]|nr:hypothetical protein [Lachnospiraceae bacterium]